MKKQAIRTMKSAKQAGFTLIELLVVIATTATLTGAAHLSGSGAGEAVARFLGR